LPLLSLSGINSNAVLSWPISTANWVLETTPALGGTNLWKTVTNVPVPLNSMDFVTNTIGGNAQFYRLRKGP